MNVARAVTYETASSSPSARAIRNAPCPPCGGATHGPRAPRLGRPPARVTTAAMAHGPIARDGGMAGRERPGRRFSAPEFATKTLSWRPKRRRRFPTCRRRCAAAAKLDVLSGSVQAVEEALSRLDNCLRVPKPPATALRFMSSPAPKRRAKRGRAEASGAGCVSTGRGLAGGRLERRHFSPRIPHRRSAAVRLVAADRGRPP